MEQGMEWNIFCNMEWSEKRMWDRMEQTLVGMQSLRLSFPVHTHL